MDRTFKQKTLTVLGKVWDVIWVPIPDDLPPAPVVAARPWLEVVAEQPRAAYPANRVPPHQRQRFMTDEERRALYSSFELPTNDDLPLRSVA
jgi:hypothetical protein